MKNFGDRIIALVVIVVALSYTGYQAYNYYYNPYKTETVFTYTVAQSVSASGVAVRQETLLEPVAGTENYLYADGTRVGIGQVVAECYNDPADGRNSRQLDQLEAEIAMLKNAQDKTINNYSNTEAINRDIRVQLSNFTRMSASGWYNDVYEMRTQLTSLLNKKQIAVGKVNDFENRIHVLQSEYDALAQSNPPQSTSTVTTPVSGYFVKNVDGYETMLTPNTVNSGTVESLLGFIEGDVPGIPSDSAGKIVTNSNWYFVCSIPQAIQDWAVIGREVTMSFDLIGNTQFPAVVQDVLSERDNDTAILILRCNRVSSDLINLRNAEARINFRSHEGLKINMSYIRFVDNQRGVYIMDDNVVAFRTIDPVYEEHSYILSSLNSADPNAVRRFDQIITKGPDLYDGKVVG